MRPLFSLLGIVALTTTLTLLSIGDADARRLGGARSFGGKSLYSQPYRRVAPASPTRQATTRPSAAQQKNAGLRNSLSRRGGLWGLLGGLALGGLLGALFFGGAFEGINFLDILILAGLAFLAYKLFTAWARRNGAQQATAAGHGGSYRAPADDPEPAAPPGARGRRAFDTDLLFKDRGPSGSGPGEAPPRRPADFDEAAFLAGAERAYRRLQEAWDAGDLETLRGLSTDAVYRELERQIRERRGNDHTEILNLRAELLEVREGDDQDEATVLYDALLKEGDPDSPGSAQAQPVREVWHFIRPAGNDHPTWYLDGIQQLEE